MCHYPRFPLRPSRTGGQARSLRGERRCIINCVHVHVQLLYPQSPCVFSRPSPLPARRSRPSVLRAGRSRAQLPRKPPRGARKVPPNGAGAIAIAPSVVPAAGRDKYPRARADLRRSKQPPASSHGPHRTLARPTRSARSPGRHRHGSCVRTP
ncbi:hypothetical protein B0H15DRAFT_810097 [Mycena belliarum]|uniref:Uncharacterized protein n=1 Tax=Mycena belliarum TaxID=1033014 RepID=A0AAD6UJ45_9AGAR|nr:hypothetical protein B0H15DRAFT_810097 [Mycena belliae]